MRICVMALLFWVSTSLVFSETFPAKDWVEKPDPIAYPNAKKGGRIVLWGHSYPSSFNYYLNLDAIASVVFGKMYPSLMGLNSLDLSVEPGIVKRMDVSDDKLVFTLHIDPRAKWSDGKLITAEDIKWTVETVLDEKNLTGPHKIGLLRFNGPEVIDERTIRFVAKEVHWLNLLELVSLQVLPKHAMQGQDFNKINFEFPVVGGPYRVKELKEGFSLTMERNANWWRAGSPAVKGMYNFDEIRFRYIAERTDAYAAFLKGQTDLHAVYTSRIWVKESTGKTYDRNWILKKKVFNHQPATLSGYICNMRNPLFQDVRVRKALAMLSDRERMNKTLMYSQYGLHRSYFEDIYDNEHPNPHSVVPFDTKKARALLDEAGWKVNSKTGIREKDGKRFSFTFLYYDSSQEKFLNIFDEALKDAGIEMRRERKDRAAWIKDLDEFNFEMTDGIWGGVLFKSAESMWHSKEADRPAGQNYSGFKNAEVDRLIESSKAEFDIKKRTEILRKIDAILVEESPFLLKWYAGYTRLLYWNRFGMPDTVLGKFDKEDDALLYWWYDEDKAEELEEAREADITLPAEPVKIHFDKTYKP